MHTIAHYLSRRQDNFLALRLIAAAMVIYGHSFVLARADGSNDIFLRNEWGIYSGDIAVAMFFVISGFMVSGSYLARSDLVAYMGARLLRIVPAFLFALVACALVLGPLFTTLPLGEYFARPETTAYVTKNIQFSSGMVWTLPGVFEGHRMTSVNGSLWTLPAEMRMYVLVAAMGVLGLLAHRRAGALVLVVLTLAGVFAPTWLPLHGDWVRLAGYFGLGILAQLYKDRVEVRHDVMVVLAGLAYIGYHTQSYPWLRAIAIGYFCFWFAYRTPRLRIERFGDASYGIYLWGWPSQQVLAALFPTMTPFPNFLGALAMATCLGYLSWWLVEKPALSLKGRFRSAVAHPGVARWREAVRRRLPGGRGTS